MSDREKDMVNRLGESCTIAGAAKAVGCCRNTMYGYIRSGKVKMCMDGRRVDVRSLARYIDGGASR